MTFVFVLTRIVANPLSNLFQKQLTQRSGHPVFIIAAVHGLLTLVCLPIVLWLPALTLAVGRQVWVTMLACAALAVGSNVLLVYALKSTDLSILGPINAYKSIVGLLLGIVLLGERPTVAGLAGMLLILGGSSAIIDRDRSRPRWHAFVQFFRERGIQLRFAALGLSATEAILLKKAILLSSPLATFVLWSLLGLGLAAVASAVLLNRQVAGQIAVLRTEPHIYLWLGLMTGLMQLSTVLTFGRLQVGYSLALFQLSTLVSVLLGHRFFQERNIRERLTGSLVMMAGAALIVMFGGGR